jgi:tripartite-type tricarboxylate transporter receptor subunit TctC
MLLAVLWRSPADFDAFIKSEIDKWAKAIKAAGVPPVDI